jgi:hypothetical protein
MSDADAQAAKIPLIDVTRLSLSEIVAVDDTVLDNALRLVISDIERSPNVLSAFGNASHVTDTGAGDSARLDQVQPLDDPLDV